MSCVILSFVLSCDNLTRSCRSQAPHKSSYNLENLQFVSRYFKQRFWGFFFICVFGQPLNTGSAVNLARVSISISRSPV